MMMIPKVSNVLVQLISRWMNSLVLYMPTSQVTAKLMTVVIEAAMMPKCGMKMRLRTRLTSPPSKVIFIFPEVFFMEIKLTLTKLEKQEKQLAIIRMVAYFQASK